MGPRAARASFTSVLTRISHLQQGPEHRPVHLVHLAAGRWSHSEGNAQHQLNASLSWSPNMPLFLVETGIFLHLYKNYGFALVNITFGNTSGFPGSPGSKELSIFSYRSPPCSHLDGRRPLSH